MIPALCALVQSGVTLPGAVAFFRYVLYRGTRGRA